MADLGPGGFNSSEVPPQDTFDAIPAGDYLCAAIESQNKETKARDGSWYLQFTFQVLEGQYKGRKLWARLNLGNKKANVVSIARSELSSICRAVGVVHAKDSIDLHNLPLVLVVKCKKDAATNEITNEIKGYKKKDGSAPTAPGVALSADTTTPPWQRK